MSDRARHRLRQVGWILPEGVDAADEMVLPAHGVDYVNHVDHGDCLPLYIIEEKPDEPSSPNVPLGWQR